ncbi:MAG: hypothetical protein HND44_12145 [Chloroflexi bacterium]|nr:hypothetical protein [Ardenticatenaceae bacterium]NOG35310.1 hypothetical protein [Chloroflexota bacterium]GIK58577.1 MAG: hypothetical protein BroJett015_42400 [Chloroflexota bacterium]
MSDDIEALKEAEKENFSFTDTDFAPLTPLTPTTLPTNGKKTVIGLAASY